jgi:hypothetical protein
VRRPIRITAVPLNGLFRICEQYRKKTVTLV